MPHPTPLDSAAYSHEQRGWWWWGLLAVGGGTLAAAVYVSCINQPVSLPVGMTLGIAGAIETLLAFAFRSLTISVDASAVTAQYGPLPLFRRTVSIPTIERVEVGRSTFADGWGIHWFPGRGWTYNISGFDCVVLTLRGDHTLRLGSDDAESLAQAIRNQRQST